MQESIFATAPPLPRGPHGLSREQVGASQRTRLMAAFTTVMAQRGYAGVTIGELASEAAVSRGAFYEHFADKEACLLAAYDHFAATLAARMLADLGDDASWETFIDTALDGYLGTLERDPISARAFLVEMDAAGAAARRRRREGIRTFARLLADRHGQVRAADPSLGPLDELAWHGFALGVRELVRESLEEAHSPTLRRLKPGLLTWVTAMIAGARPARG